MSHPDRPFTRPLAGVDQALGEGRARQPVELLDQLRERLDRLDQNHPSSPRSTDRHEVRGQDATPDQGASADLAADQAAAAGQSQQASRPDRSSLRKEGAGPSRDDQPGDQGAGEPPPVSRPGQPAAADSVASGMADDGQYRVVQTGRTADGEPYRPWFADEPGSPWFVDPWFVE